MAFAMVINIMTSYLLVLGGTKLQMGGLGSISAFISLISNPIVVSLRGIQSLDSESADARH